MSKQKITVEWFDELKGIGEGKSPDGRTVFLNSKYIVPSASFLTLRVGEIAICEVDEKLFASSIVRSSEKPDKL